MQLCRCINCFLKPHNKQLNQYCLNFTIFLPQKKKFLKNGSGWVRSQVNPFLFRVKKSGSGWVGSENSNPTRVFYGQPHPTYDLAQTRTIFLKLFFFLGKEK